MPKKKPAKPISRPTYIVPKNDAFFVKFSYIGATAVSLFLGWITLGREYSVDMMTLYLKLGGKLFLICFLFAFSASSLYYFFPCAPTKWLRFHRKYFGLSAVVIMFFHFIIIGVKILADHSFFVNELTPDEWLPSVVILYFVASMALTSSAKMHKRLGPRRWQRLHTWGGNLILGNIWYGTIDGFSRGDVPLFLAATTVILLKAFRSLHIRLESDKISVRKVYGGMFLAFVLGSVIVQMAVPEPEPPPPPPPIQPVYSDMFKGQPQYSAHEYFPLHRNNAWTYRVSNGITAPAMRSYTVREEQVQARRRIFHLHVTDDTYMVLLQDNYGIRLLRNIREGSTWNFDPPSIQLPNLALGQQKTFDVGLKHEAPETDRTQDAQAGTEFKLMALESVTVPAGTYSDCLKIEYTRRISYPGGSYHMVRGTTWYARHIGQVKDQQYIEKYDANTKKTFRTEELLELVAVSIQKD